MHQNREAIYAIGYLVIGIVAIWKLGESLHWSRYLQRYRLVTLSNELEAKIISTHSCPAQIREKQQEQRDSKDPAIVVRMWMESEYDEDEIKEIRQVLKQIEQDFDDYYVFYQLIFDTTQEVDLRPFPLSTFLSPTVTEITMNYTKKSDLKYILEEKIRKEFPHSHRDQTLDYCSRIVHLLNSVKQVQVCENPELERRIQSATGLKELYYLLLSLLYGYSDQCRLYQPSFTPLEIVTTVIPSLLILVTPLIAILKKQKRYS